MAKTAACAGRECLLHRSSHTRTGTASRDYSGSPEDSIIPATPEACVSQLDLSFVRCNIAVVFFT